jgi:hypothetical protein
LAVEEDCRNLVVGMVSAATQLCKIWASRRFSAEVWVAKDVLEDSAAREEDEVEVVSCVVERERCKLRREALVAWAGVRECGRLGVCWKASSCRPVVGCRGGGLVKEG